MENLTTRWQHLRQLWRSGVLTILAAGYSIVGLASFIRDNFVPPESRAAWDTLRVIPHWELRTWGLVALLIVVVGIFEGSYRLRRTQEGVLRRYRANDPRIEVVGVEADGYSPYRITVTATVENPGEPTILRSWALVVTRGTGEEVAGRLARHERWICRSYEPTKDVLTSNVDHSTTPLRTGGTANASLTFEFAEPWFALGLNETTCFTVSCRTIKNVRVQGAAARALSQPQNHRRLDEPAYIDKHLNLSANPTRSNWDRLSVARSRFDELVDAAAAGSEDARKSLYHFGQFLVGLSRDCHGATMEYARDFDRYRDGLIRGKYPGVGASGGW